MTDHNVIGLPLPYDGERFVRRGEMARILGLGLRTFDELCARGRREGNPPPVERWGCQVVVFLPSRTIAWARSMANGKVA